MSRPCMDFVCPPGSGPVYALLMFARGVGPDRKSKTFVNILRGKPCCVALVTALLAASALSMLRTLAPPNIIFEAVRFGKFAPRNKAEQVHLPVYTHTYIRVCRRAGALPSPVFFLVRNVPPAGTWHMLAPWHMLCQR